MKEGFVSVTHDPSQQASNSKPYGRGDLHVQQVSGKVALTPIVF
jgi:hypothetical protein